MRRPAASLAANEGPSALDDVSVAQRLDALRRSSGALTHDFNNLLGVILSASERLAGDLPEGSEQHKLALLALEAAERGAELLRRSLALTQDPEADPDTVDAAPALETLKRLARQAIGPDVRLKVCLPAERLSCRGDRTGLEMALLNLCLNADQAMPGGGAIAVEARTVRLDRSDRLGLAAGLYAAFTVRDTGCGMSPETLARATEALFTTKPAGTGLGLSSVLDFATAAGGTLSLWSREGHGATATLYLPLAAPAITVVAA
jgi:signal transduction histidine kinase